MSKTKSILLSWWQEYLKLSFSKELLVGALAAIIGLGGSHWYRSSRDTRELKAHKMFVESYELYEQALLAQHSEKSTQKAQQLWQEAEMMFQAGYLQNSNSYLGPYFLAFEAESVRRQGRHDEALRKMDNFLSKISAKDALYSPYMLKCSLMKLDSSDSGLHFEGISELEILTQNQSDVSHDTALYYLGQYYWAHEERDKAQALWDRIKDLEQFGDNSVKSPWHSLIESKV